MAEPVVIIGAGAAGLATARELALRRIPYRILERGSGAGQTWADLYDSLRLHTGRHLSALPGLRLNNTPLFPSRIDYHVYLQDYARRFEIPVESNSEVTHVRADNEGWSIDTVGGSMWAPAIVIATGIVTNPQVPQLPGRELFERDGRRVLHSIVYRRPDMFVGRRVLIVGVGNSGGEIGTELARSGAHVSVAVRSGAHVVPLTIAGVPIQYIAHGMRSLPKSLRTRVVGMVRVLSELRRGPPVLPLPAHGPLDAIPLIGFHFVDEIKAGRVRVLPGIDRFVADGMRFSDGSEHAFDDVILATGFRAALQPFGNSIACDARGFALRTDRVTSAQHDNVFFVGHNYDSSGGLLNIARDAPLAAQAVERLLIRRLPS